MPVSCLIGSTSSTHIYHISYNACKVKTHIINAELESYTTKIPVEKNGLLYKFKLLTWKQIPKENQ